MSSQLLLQAGHLRCDLRTRSPRGPSMSGETRCPMWFYSWPCGLPSGHAGQHQFSAPPPPEPEMSEEWDKTGWPLQCPICGNDGPRFTREDQLARHMSTVHPHG